MENAIIYFDGGGENPGIMKACAILIFEDGNYEVFYESDLGYGTNNVAEWSSLLLGLYRAYDYGIKNVECYGDSKLVVQQANKKWQIKKEHLKPFRNDFDILREAFDTIRIQHVPRDNNYAGQYLEYGHNDILESALT